MAPPLSDLKKETQNRGVEGHFFKGDYRLSGLDGL